MSDQGKRLKFFLKKFVGKKWLIILAVTKFFTHDFLHRRNFMPTILLPIR